LRKRKTLVSWMHSQLSWCIRSGCSQQFLVEERG
jgi:hypothetical protein